MQTKPLEAKRQFINNKIIIGIDPSKEKHQAIPLNSIGIPIGKSFTFKNNYGGFHEELWRKLKKLIGERDPQEVVFAIEASINFWQKLCEFINKKGYTVLMVSPLHTKHERPKINNNNSRTDPRDALAVASCARNGYYMFYNKYSPEQSAMHRLSITYEKLKVQMVQTKQRIRSQMELIFPEFTEIINIDTDTARYLLSKYMSPGEFSRMNIFYETPEVESISGKQISTARLKVIKEAAQKTVGIKLSESEIVAERITLNMWLGEYVLFEKQIEIVLDELIKLAEKNEDFKILVSIKGISEITAARFLAEIRDFSLFDNYKKIEAFAGANLRLSQSGQYSGYRGISHIGNNRLRALLYTMTEETKKYIPEVRIRYIKRQMDQPRYKKNIIACTSNLLKLITALIKKGTPYEYYKPKQEELAILEEKYKEFKEKKKKYKNSSIE